MKKILLFMITFFLSSLGSIHPQEKVWSLEECIKYAIDNNIQIKQQVVQTQFKENTLEQSKLTLLPTLNGQASHNYSFNRTLDQTTYQYVDQNGQSNQFYIGGSLNLFNGLQNYNTIRKNKYQLLASELDLQSIKDNISLSIALAYLQILLNNELVTATGNQLQITNQQIDKTKKDVQCRQRGKRKPSPDRSPGSKRGVAADKSEEPARYLIPESDTNAGTSIPRRI